jgi:hypothetical protein
MQLNVVNGARCGQAEFELIGIFGGVIRHSRPDLG